MKALLTILGAALGRRALGLPGLVLGGGLGYGLTLLLRPGRRLLHESRLAGQGATVLPHSRYPEEEIVDALRQIENDPDAQGEELEDLLEEVSTAGRQRKK